MTTFDTLEFPTSEPVSAEIQPATPDQPVALPLTEGQTPTNESTPTTTTSVDGESNRYTDEAIASLVAYWNADYTVREIAERMGRTYNSVRNKVASLQKRGLISPRDNRNTLPVGFIEQTAGEYNLPIETVAFFVGLFGKGARHIVAGVKDACEAWVAQNGECYYLRGRVRLSRDTSPSGIVPMYLADGQLILVCRAVASVRKTMSHGGFVSMCKHIANAFELA